MINKIYSIEPLRQEHIEKISNEINVDVILLNRDSFLNLVEEATFLDIRILICRDRDNVADIIEVCANLELIFIVSTGVEK